MVRAGSPVVERERDIEEEAAKREREIERENDTNES